MKTTGEEVAQQHKVLVVYGSSMAALFKQVPLEVTPYILNPTKFSLSAT